MASLFLAKMSEKSLILSETQVIFAENSADGIISPETVPHFAKTAVLAKFR